MRWSVEGRPVRPGFVAALVAVLMSPGACGESQKGQVGEDLDSSGTPDDVIPVVPVDELIVQTGVSDDGPAAGETVAVFCTVGRQDQYGNVAELSPDQEIPETRWEIYTAPAGIAHEPEIDGDTVVFKSTGEYQIRCVIVDTGWADPSPSKVRVGPGDAVDIETIVDPATIMAGSTANVSCTGADEFGNEIVDDWELVIQPGGNDPGPVDGLISANFMLKGMAVGTYKVACKQRWGSTDPDPVLVTVTHGLPYRIVTELDEDSIVAGYSTRVTCRAEDKLGNEVPDLPMTLVLPSAIGLQGLDVTGTVSGKYIIKCVPESLEWSAFVLVSAILEIVPDVPVSLELALKPPKPVFRKFEQVKLEAIGRDQYDNPVINPDLDPFEVDPDQDYVHAPDTMTFKFKAEGYFTITGRLAEDPNVSASVEVAVAGMPPGVVVTYPERGATIQGYKPSVNVQGITGAGIANVVKVTVNGQDASLWDNEDGSQTFSTIIVPKWGMNVIDVEAIDEVGVHSFVRQSFYFAEQYYPIEPEAPNIPDAIKAWLAKEFIDDGVHNPTQPDDLATILETVIAGMDLTSLAAGSFDVGAGYELKIKSITMNPPKLALNPVEGGLDADVDVKNVKVKVKLEGECKVLGIDLCPDFGGSVSIDLLHFDVLIYAAAAQGVLDVSLGYAKVDLQGIDLNIDGILGWLFDWLIDFVVGLFSDMIVDMFQDQMTTMIQDALAEVFTSLVISETFDVPPILPGMDPLSLTLDSSLWSLHFKPDGGRLGLAARILTVKKVAQQILGTIARGTCLKGYPVNWQLPGAGEFEVGLFDDFLNQMLTAIWQTGLMNLYLDEEAIAGLAGGDGGDGSGLDLQGLPIDSIAVTTDFLLPPIVNGCDPSGVIKLQIGDAFIDAELGSSLFYADGGVGKLGLYAYIEISAEIKLTETDEGGAALALQLLGIDRMDFYWEYVPTIFEGNEQALEDLLKNELLGSLLGDLTAAPIFEFAIPELDLGALTPLFGEGIIISPAIEQLSREGGHTLLEGYLE